MLAVIALVSLGAATITGALGYGYSSLTVPIALLMVPSKRLNPALVIVEFAVNGYSAWINRKAIPAILPRALPVIAGVVPGVIAGSLLLDVLPGASVKAICYVVLLPLILIQAGGVRLRVRRERAVGAPFGLGVGLLYSLTTISGPPLALWFNNQGLTKSEFKVALAITRVAESTLTLVTYSILGLFTQSSGELALWLIPGVLVGMPLGHLMIQKVAPETFRRVCMSFDAWLVGFGLSRIVADAGVVPPAVAYQILTLTVIVDAIMLRRFFSRRSVTASPAASADPAPAARSA